jgi:hypothetical protein
VLWQHERQRAGPKKLGQSLCRFRPGGRQLFGGVGARDMNNDRIERRALLGGEDFSDGDRV